MPTDGHYRHSEDPAVADEVDSELTAAQRQLLEKLYSEVCTTWRALLDVRFKLLGLVPFVTVAVLAVLLPDTGSSRKLSGSATYSICAVGLIVTLGLLIYEIRNSELYDDLISRGRRIEAELGVKRGIFRGRPKSGWPLVNHGTAIALIYFAALAGWAFALFSAA